MKRSVTVRNTILSIALILMMNPSHGSELQDTAVVLGPGILSTEADQPDIQPLVLTGPSDSVYMMANGLYENGDFESALVTFREIVKRGVESADLYYNMGNAAYRSNNIGYAILYFEKALKLDPSHEDAAFNLRHVSQFRVDVFDEIPELFIRSWVRSAVTMMPEKVWSLLAIVLFALVLFMGILYLFARSLLVKKVGFYSALVALLLFVLSLGSAVSQHQSVVSPDEAIILAPSVVVRSTPSESGTELFILHEGTRVDLKEDVAGWSNIRVVDGREGWISAGDFESI